MSNENEHFAGMSREQFLRRAASAGIAVGGFLGLPGCGSDDSGTGSTQTTAATPKATGRPTKPFDPNVPAGAKCPLPKRIAFSAPFQSPLMEVQVGGMKAAANDRGIPFVSANSLGDAAKQTQQIRTFMQQGISGMDVEATDGEAVRPLKLEAIKAGVCVTGTVVGPTTIRLAQDQAEVGRALGTTAAEFIKTELGGKAQVVYFPVGQFAQALKARDQAVVDAVKTAGSDVKVTTIEPQGSEMNADGGFKLTNTALQANPGVTVWLGPDVVLVGTLAALEAAGKAKDPNVFIAGIDGVEEALKKVEQGGAYRASIGQPLSLGSYALGQYMADWLEGKSVPQIVITKPIVLDSKAAIDDFNKNLALSAVPETFKSSADYLTLLGNISYETRENYLAEDF